jgi:N-acyl-D-amino-acid deacylase
MMSHRDGPDTPDDFVLRGGTVVDGTGAAARRADVEVRAGRIVGVGTVAARTDVANVDVSDLVVAPGFIDIHTHYDAQVQWDPALDASARHGVTTIVMGNCGFTLAPTHPEDRSDIVHLLRVVEGMSADVLEAGIQWDFETFPQYIAVLQALPLALNVAAMVGHDAVRRYAMGAAAQQRVATSEETLAMGELVSDAVHAGAIGFSTDRSSAHVDASGRSVPSMFADDDEVLALCTAAAAAGAAIVELACGRDFGIDDHVEIAQQTGLGVTPTALLSGLYPPDEIETILETANRAEGKVLPQVSPRPRLHYLTLSSPVEWLRMSEAFGDALELDRAGLDRLYRDDSWRQRAAATLTPRGDKMLTTGVVAESARHQDLIGIGIAEIARTRSVTPFDAMVDLALQDLDCRFVYSMYNDDEEIVSSLLLDPRTILGLSDAGAHSDRVYDANFPTYLLGHWVRELGSMPLEFAIWRLTGQVAAFMQLPDRGRIASGCAADLVAFDPERIGTLRETRVHDLPAGGDRLIAESEGIEHLWVNGAPIRRDGVPVPAASGVVIGT